LEGTWKEVLMTCFKVLSQYLVEEEAQESHKTGMQTEYGTSRTASGVPNTRWSLRKL